ncbi:MAG: hypothetical protein WA941_04750 [Nitrososphaeraceae archaeon]
MDTAIIVGVVIGSVVAMALVFGKTVLGVAWTGTKAGRLGISETSSQNGGIQEYSINTNNPKRESRLMQTTNQKLIDRQKANIADSLINKQVSTCDNIVIGNIHAVHNRMIVITRIGSLPQDMKYEIPAYYVRHNYQNDVLMDICARDLEHYNPQLVQ